MKYHVTLKERVLYTRIWEVEANNAEEAADLAYEDGPHRTLFDEDDETISSDVDSVEEEWS